MRLLGLAEVLKLHRRVIDASGGSHGLRDRGALESALAQPSMSFGGEGLYPGLVAKAAALGASLVQNHPFVDGNKRIGHAAMELTLWLNGMEIDAGTDEQEDVILRLAAGELDRDDFISWVKSHTRPR